MSENRSFPLWQRLIFSPFVLKASRARKIAYVALMVALAIVCNMYFEFKLGAVQYSFTTAVSMLIGLLIGGGAGFVACFIGDAIGFIANPFGAYTPWIGLATGLTALISGAVFHLIKTNRNWHLYVKVAFISLLSFAVCSLGINSTFLWLSYYSSMSYGEWLAFRYIASGQIIVSAVNYALLFILVPVLKKVAFFKDLEL